ncbi:putative ribonuclease H-like domain-containing protein [Tanacetum coccineum]
MTDYSLWEVILNGNKVLKRTIGETEQEYEPTTAEEKKDRRNDMKDRGTLLMALPNKDQLKFHSYKDAKHGSHREERNKEEIETISLDDLYNNVKIYEPELVGLSSIRQNPQNVAFVSSNSTNSNCNSSTNEANNTAYVVSAAHTQCNHTSRDNLSDAMICAFLASQPNSPQLASEDLEQIDPYDLEEIDLQWEMAMLTIRDRRFIQRTGRNLDVNGQRVGFDRTKVETGSTKLRKRHPTNFALMVHTSSGSSSSSDSEVIRPVWNNSSRVNHKNFANKITHPHPNRKFVPQAVLTRSGKINTAGASVNTAVRPVNTAGSKTTVNHSRPISNTFKKGYSQVTKPFNKDGKGRISRKGKIKTGTLDFDNVYFCKELKYNLFSVLQICDKENNVLFTNTECLVLSSDFKLLDESQVLLRVPRKDNIYSVDLKSVVPTKGLTCLFAKAMMNPIYGIRGLVFFLATKDETSGILKTFITEIENQLDHKVKVIRCDNGTEFKNSVMNQFCEMKGIKREFSVARTPQQNGVAERRNRTLIEAARTMDHLGNQTNGTKDSEEDAGVKPTELDESKALDKDGKDYEDTGREFERLLQLEKQPNSTNTFNTVGTPVNVPNVFSINDTGIFGNAYNDEDVGATADLNNLETTTNVSPIPTTRIDKDHPKDQIIGDFNLAIQTRRMTKISDEHAMKVIQALEDPSWIETMQEELLQFQLQKV